jgi:hypothetical protein
MIISFVNRGCFKEVLSQWNIVCLSFIHIVSLFFCVLCWYRQENMARKAAGEEPLPEEDPSNPIFKPIPEPSRLEGYLVTNQISSYCNHINGYRF